MSAILQFGEETSWHNRCTQLIYLKLRICWNCTFTSWSLTPWVFQSLYIWTNKWSPCKLQLH
jgi:hypothetical protein